MKISFEYLAGLIDGEGCLYIAKYCKNGSYTPRLDIGMSNKAKDVLYMLKDRFGGSVNICRPPTDKWDGAMKWSIQGKKCCYILMNCRDSFIIKRDQADLLLQLQDMIDGLDRMPNKSAKWSDDAKEKAEALKCYVNDLNAKGPENESTEKS